MLGKGARRGFTGGGGGRSEGASAERLLSGERKRYGRGGRQRYRKSDSRRQGVSTGSLLSGGGVTGGAHRRHDDRCRERRGTRKRHGRG